MYFVVEYQGQRKTVKALATATITEVNHLAFGFEEGGDTRAKDVRIIGSRRREDVAAGMMCRVWPAQETLRCACCKATHVRLHSIYCSERCKQAFLAELRGEV
jgi:hypothetical protein